MTETARPSGIEAMIRPCILGVLVFGLVVSCRGGDNEAEIRSILNNGVEPLRFLGEIDMDVTNDCGRATPATTTTGTTNPSPGTGTSNNNTNNTRFSIISQFTFKTQETLNIRFIYDSLQTQGRIDPQQGFILTGGLYNKTVQGNQGTVRWFGTGINIDTTNQGAQSINFMNIEVNLNGTYAEGSTSTSNILNSCNTLDGVNCTSGQSTTQCFTADNRTCLVQNNSSTAQPANILGRIECSAPNIIP